MPERLSLFRSASHAGSGGVQASEQQQQQRRHQQEQQQQQQEQRRDPAAATLGTLPAAATPKCWAVVQTPLETLYDDEEEDSEESGYFNQTGTTAITPIYGETGHRSSTASAAAKQSATATPALLVTEEGSMAGRPLAEATGEKVAAILQGRGAPQHTKSEPHDMTCQLSHQKSVSQSTALTAHAVAQIALPPAASTLQQVDAAPASGARGGGSSSNTSTSSLRPLLRLKTSSSVPNIQSHFKTRTLLRRPRSRNSGKEEGLQRETAFWGGDLLSDGDDDEQAEQQSSSTSSVKWPFGKELSDSLLRRRTVASGASVTSRGCTAPPAASLFLGVGDGHSTRVQSCGERGAAGSAFPSSRLTSAGAATSVTTVFSLPTQQQQLLTPRSPQQESSVPGHVGDSQALSLIGSSTPQQRDTSSVSSPQAAEASTSLSREGGVSHSKGILAATPAAAEHATNKEVSKGLPLLRRSLFHPFRKHICVSEELPGGSCPDFRATRNTSSSSLSLGKSSTDVTDKRRNRSQQQLLHCAAGQVAAPVTRGSSGGLPPLPHRRCQSKSGGDLPAVATAAAGAPLSSHLAYALTGDMLEAASKPSVDARASAASVAVAALSSSSSFLDAARRTARNRKAASAAARASPQAATKAEAVEAAAEGPAPAAPPGEKIESTAPVTLSHLPPPCTFRMNAGKTPAAAGAAAAAAMHVAGIGAPAVAGGAPVASTPSNSISLRAQAPEKQRSLAGAEEAGGAVSEVAAEVMQPSVQRTAATGERGVCVTAVPHAGENGLHPAVGSNQNSSGSSASGDAVCSGSGVSTVSTAAGGGRTGSNVKGTGGLGGVHRSGSFSSLSKKLSIRALKLRSGSGLSAPTAAGTSSAAATLSSTPTSATSSPHPVISHIVVHNEEGDVLAPHQQQQSDSHRQQQEQQSEMTLQSPMRALESLRFSPIPAVLEEEGSQCSRSSSSSLGREEAA